MDHDGIVLVGNTTLGTFSIRPYPWQAIDVEFKHGLNVRDTFEFASENGMPIVLQMTPKIPEGG